ncbi:UNVERIFIED_ORG: anaerobic nitric oxide reductase transcription regulator [Pseudomonas lini]|uniref:nitric oxide reductase transcriptional regulator NorR n=1 Tax=Pseudomonas viciae TaxID=2505979 RepID=UPI0021137C31|nr:nitric oxide reductase transcriptional regulator NorR [Pseudomonas viciae]UZE87408.1 nitric oxide reductase transcriptional regulator NorR [Pseudomonas viciae]
MTATSLLTALLPLVADLSRELPEGERYRRLLGALRALLPCDAAALLRLDGDCLVPLAVDGLSTDTLGRRFRVNEHPRFAALLANPLPTRFAADSNLPDPYDGLVEGLAEHLEVHDCMGCPLFVDERPWGLLTLDSLDPGSFEPIDLSALQAFASLAAATVSAAARIERLALKAEDEHRRAEVYRQASGQQQRDMIGQSKPHKRLVEEIKLVGGSDLTVLITGETGVGKELVAQAIHAASKRAEQPLISLNCAALPDTLVESELFGHVRGAFTGATSDRRGKFELADGGTLFLDEVGELSLTVQAKLLRVLQSGQLQRLGSDREHRVDVRLIAATNRDLAEEVRNGRYRADFYHRLSVYPLQVPALRDRGRDVLLLSGFFLEQNRSRMGLNSLRLSSDAQAALLAYDWPGNVRELEHLIGRSALKALGNCAVRPKILSLSAQDLDLPQAAEDTPAPSSASPVPTLDGVTGDLRDAMDDFQRRLIGASLERHQHNWASAARELGLDRANLGRMARRLGLK